MHFVPLTTLKLLRDPLRVPISFNTASRAQARATVPRFISCWLLPKLFNQFVQYCRMANSLSNFSINRFGLLIIVYNHIGIDQIEFYSFGFIT